MSKTIVFFSIGNPGPATRHSVGHLILKKLIDGFQAKQLAKKGKYSITTLDNVIFVRSNAYMNESGASIQAFLSSERTGPCTIVILYDDFEIDLPRVRLQTLKKNESHNGMRSIQKATFSLPHEVYKLGCGVGPKPQGASTDAMAAFVLSDFTQQQKSMIPAAMEYIYEYVHRIIESDGNIGDCNKVNAQVTKKLQSS